MFYFYFILTYKRQYKDPTTPSLTYLPSLYSFSCRVKGVKIGSKHRVKG